MKDLVIDDRERGVFRVHRSSMTSSDLLRREQEQIFDRCWIYVGHESEVGKAGRFQPSHSSRSSGLHCPWRR